MMCCAMSGDYCEDDVNECEASTTACLNGAACINELGSYSCNCTLGYIGRRCDTANCSLDQCLNNGSCRVDDAGRWWCECLQFYTGMFHTAVFPLTSTTDHR